MKKDLLQPAPESFSVTVALREVRQIVDEQAEDEGLWFVAEHASEAYLQSELRRLHAAIEAPALGGQK